MSSESFAAHMTAHMALVAVAAPLLALGVAGSQFDPVRFAPRLFAPIAASLVDLVGVWGWHLPSLHHAARRDAVVFVLEQGSFLAAGVFLWMAVLGGDSTVRRGRAAVGAVALVFTSMHMTLLGALFALAPRPLFQHGVHGADGLGSLHAGGVVMILTGGASYLIGGLWLIGRVLHSGPSIMTARGE